MNQTASKKSTLKAIFKVPVSPNIRWNDILNLLIHLGADIREGKGSRVIVELNGEEAVFHRPHPGSETDRGAVRSVRRFLENAGVDTYEI